MCGRYFLQADGELLAERFALAESPPPVARYNIAPGQPGLVVYAVGESNRAEFQSWGFAPHWAGPEFERRPINIRAETVAEKPLFRDAWRRGRRCIVPASGFYEWEQTAIGKMPWAIAAADGALLGMAGLWDEWRSPQGGLLRGFAILTREADAPVSELHARMPVLLPNHHQTLWLRGPREAARAILALPNEVALRRWRVSRRVNDPSQDDPALTEPWDASTGAAD